MKSQKEIEQLADAKYLQKAEAINDSEIRGYIVSATKGGYIDGYTQCQKDMESLLIEIKNNWTGDKLIGGTYEKICNSLNKQE